MAVSYDCAMRMRTLLLFLSVYQYPIHPTAYLPRNHKTFNLAFLYFGIHIYITKKEKSKSVIAPQDSVRLESSGRKRISLQFEHIFVCGLKLLVVIFSFSSNINIQQTSTHVEDFLQDALPTFCNFYPCSIYKMYPILNIECIYLYISNLNTVKIFNSCGIYSIDFTLVEKKKCCT